MITAKQYRKLKKHIRCMCRTNVIKMADNMMLNDEERYLLLAIYDKQTRTKICLDMAISTTYYHNHTLELFSKIEDYLKTYSN